MIPTSQWHPGQIWRDEYNVYVDDDAAAPTRLLLKVGLYNSDQGGDIPAFGPQGEAIDLLVVGQARLGAEKRNSQKPTVSIESRLSDGFTFLGYDLDSASLLPGGEAPLDLYWGAAGTPSTDYTVFVHLLDSGGGQLATADGPPLSGDYPTSLWQKGDVVVDRHLLAIPDTIEPGTYQLSVGLYDPDTLARVQLADGSGDTISWPIEINSDR